MPTDLSANLTIKFSFASRGILSLNGFAVDPSYGSDTESGSRLHFILANVGAQDVTIQPRHDKFASIQFLPVIGSNDFKATTINIPQSPNRIDKLFSDADMSLGLSFFKEQDALKGKIHDLETKWEKEIKSLDHVVYFGHFLLGSAIFGIVLTVTFSLMSKMETTLTLVSEHLVASVAVMGFIVGVLIGGPFALIRATRKR